MSKFTKAKILAHDAVGANYFRLVLRAPEAAAAAVPGQFVMLRVSENLDPLLARPFGISSILLKRSLEIIYAVVGRGTRMLSQLEPGRSLDMLGPLGNGFPMPEKGAKPVLIAGGCGFPPLHFLAERLGRRKFSAEVFVGAKNRAALPPAHIIKSFKRTHASVHLATEDGSQGTRGMVTGIVGSYLAKTVAAQPVMMYACGPRSMLAAIAELAGTYSVPCYLSMEERMGCGLGACMGCSVPTKNSGYKRVCKEGPVFKSDELAWSSSDMKNPSPVAQCCSHSHDIISA